MRFFGKNIGGGFTLKSASLMRSDIKVGGFTLIELLVVISIIGILTAIATVSYTNVQQKGRDGKRKADLSAIQQALAVYYSDKGYYPPGNSVSDSVGWCTHINNNSYPEVKNALVAGYIKEVPKDPIFPGISGDYFYKKKAGGHYEMGAVLENTNDPEINITFNFNEDYTSGGLGGWGNCAGYVDSTYNYLVKDK